MIYIYARREKMAPTNAEFIKRIIREGFFDYSLGGCYFQNCQMEFFTEVMDSYSMAKMFLKYLEIEVSRVEESQS
jgi:hypothetical protein